MDRNALRSGVLHDIVQGFLGNAIAHHLHIGGNLLIFACNRDGDGEPRSSHHRLAKLP